MKGPGIFLAQFLSDEAPFNSLENICQWVADLGYKGIQIPTWEIVLSMTILAITFVFSTWFAGRIYRIGILMYGKKVTYKELWKWFLYSSK